MKKSFFIVLVLVLLSICVYLFRILYQDAKQSAIKRLNEEQFVHARQAAQGVEDFFAMWTQNLASLANMEEIKDNKDQGKSFIRSFFEANKQHIKSITRVNQNGVIQYSYPFNNVIGKDISSQKHIQKILLDHKPGTSDVFWAVQGYYAIALHVPVMRGNEFLGTLAVLINFQDLTRHYFDVIRVGTTGYSWVISREGILLFSPVKGYNGKSVVEIQHQFPSVSPMLTQMMQGNTGTSEYLFNYVGNNKTSTIKKYAFYMPIKLTDNYWSIAVSSSEDEALSSIDSYRNRLLALIVVLFSLGIIFTIYGAKAWLIFREEEKRKKSEDALRISEERFRSTFEQAAVGIAHVNPDGRFLRINQRFCDILGYKHEELLQKTFQEITHPAFLEENLEVRDQLAAQQKKSYNTEKQYIRKDNTIIWVNLTVSAVYNSEGKTDYFISVVEDITHRKNVEAELIHAKERAEESDRLKSAFLANMSHEIRTPMNGILGFSKLLSEPGLTDEKQKKYSTIIQKSGNRMLNIINEIIDISKIESGTIETHYREENLNKRLESIFDLFKPEAESKSIQLSFSPGLPTEESVIQTDNDKLHAIVTNLVKNAIKYTDAGFIEFGYVLSKNPEPLEFEFFVKDTGIGIATNRQAAIFERFIQAEIADVQARQGAGLGLAIAKSYVEMLGGKIWVESEQGKGSTFYFTLPYKIHL